jgi:iron complex transport system substrate-binding protein
VLSLDQCADQFVLALSPRAAIAGLSTRADDADSRLRALAVGLPKRRVDLESALAARPQVVVRYWGGDPRLVRALESRGVQVVTVTEARSFSDVRANIRRVALALDQRTIGEALIVRMDQRLSRAAGTWGGTRALYLTPGGATAGPGTLVDAILTAAGMTNAETRSGFQTVSLEQMALTRPPALVLGFFDTFQAGGDSWGIGGHQILRTAVRERTVASLPGSMLGCPDASSAEAVELLAARAVRR